MILKLKRQKVVSVVGKEQDVLSILVPRVSSWVKIQKVLALVVLFKLQLISKISKGKICLKS